MACRTKVGLVDRVTRAVRDHSCDVPILGVSDRKDDPSEESPSEDNLTEDNPRDGCYWLSQQFRLEGGSGT